MRTLLVNPGQILVSTDLTRSGRSKQFEERLEASIEAIGLAEPIKVARLPSRSKTKQYLVVDGVLRWRAIRSLRARNPGSFRRIPVYVVDYDRRFEIRYQTDIYQDLLPSQLAALVEHLHRTEGVSKGDIAQYIGISAATLRNYTGVFRLVERRGLFAKIVDLMDAGAVPSSNPFAWLRLTEGGLRRVIEEGLAKGDPAEAWIADRLEKARLGTSEALPLKAVEALTGGLPSDCYREAADVREMKQKLGLRRASSRPLPDARLDTLAHLSQIADCTQEPILRIAANSLKVYLQ